MIWLPFCNRRPGPDWKQGYPGIPKRSLDQIEGEAKHSAEGPRSAMYGVLDGPNRLASWTFSIFKVGPPDQHYPLESVPWTNGSPLANLKFIGEEHEGVEGEELNANQILWTAQITGSVRELCPKVAANPPALRLNLWEHNWLTIFGADPTACPSGRIPWAKVIAALQTPVEEDDMAWTDTQVSQALTRLANINAQVDELPAIKSRLANLDGRDDQILEALNKILAVLTASGGAHNHPDG